MDKNESIFDGTSILNIIEDIIKQTFGENEIISLKGIEYNKDSFKSYILMNFRDTLSEYFTMDLHADIDDQKKHYNSLMNTRKRRISSKLNTTLSLIKAIILKSLEVGAMVHDTIEIDQRDGSATIPNGEMVKFVLLKIHSRAMEVCGEILNLLEYGYVLGALARWRSLFEYTVIAQVLIDLDDFEVAIMYLKHDTVSYYKSAKDLLQYAKHKTPDFNEIQEDYERLVEMYGANYVKSYGWYKPNQRIDFISLAIEHKMTTLLGYFRESNMPNHGSSFRIFEGNQSIKDKINSFEIPVQNMVISIGTLNQSILQYFMRLDREPTIGFVSLMNFFSTAIEQVTKTFFEERQKVDKDKPDFDSIPPKG